VASPSRPRHLGRCCFLAMREFACSLRAGVLVLVLKTSSQRDECGRCCFELARRLQHSWPRAVDVDPTLLLLAKRKVTRPRVHAHQQRGLRRQPLPAVYLQAKSRSHSRPHSGTLQRHQPRVTPPSAQSPSQSVRPPPSPRRRRSPRQLRGTRSSARPRSSRRYRHDGRLPGRCRLTLAAHGQPPFVNSSVCDSHQSISSPSSPARRVRMVQVFTSVALGPSRSWPWLTRLRRERRRRVVTSSDRQRGRCEGPATDFGLLAAVIKCPQSHIT
jgi:hypothetical protein